MSDTNTQQQGQGKACAPDPGAGQGGLHDPGLRLRRGDDYTIVDTRGEGFSYHPEKISMERTEDAAFGPVDRIGQLTMRNLDIMDTRQKLDLYRKQGQIEGGQFELT